jgi:hypothetical protein
MILVISSPSSSTMGFWTRILGIIPVVKYQRRERDLRSAFEPIGWRLGRTHVAWQKLQILSRIVKRKERVEEIHVVHVSLTSPLPSPQR